MNKKYPILLFLMIILNARLIGVMIVLFFAVSSIGIGGTTSLLLAMQNGSPLGLISFLLGSMTAPLVGLGNENSALPMGIVIVVCQLIALSSYIFLIHRKIKHSTFAKSENFLAYSSIL
ncbi:MFS transporter [Lederbergia citri]|uniref:Uncharacterized protein n=1 Tax=Lederbergia citri TaxID=2833580 RepID=A0A942TGG8_9BACI|nr:hypothetical protein [Lederbergia citri]MBS4195924.1 hypothetical protein [Lederbergia citri]